MSTDDNDRNKERRARYASDEEYRESTKSRSRQGYRAKYGRQAKEPRDVLTPVSTLVTVTGKKRIGVVTTQAMAQALRIKPKTYLRWIAERQVPAPTHKISSAGRRAYTTAEAAAIIDVLAAHFQEFDYYRVDHVETRDRVFTRFRKAAKKGKDK